MCGLFGYSGKEAQALAIKFGLLDNEVRGKHSTGVYGKHMFKVAGAATAAIKDPKFALAVNGAKEVVGHTRWATMGEHSVENAHPYDREWEGKHLIGTHNGWLIEDSMKRAISEFDFLEETPVDSMLIFDLLLRSGMDYETLSRLDGAMALAFIDEEQTLTLYRRQSKPLFIGHHEDGIFYSSREQGLEMIDCDDIFEVPKNGLLQFKEGKLVDSFRISKPDITSIPLDCTMYSWRTHTSIEEDKVYPRTTHYNKTTWKGGNSTSASNFHGHNNHANRFNTVDNSFPPKRSTTPVGASKDDLEKQCDALIKNMQELDTGLLTHVPHVTTIMRSQTIINQKLNNVKACPVAHVDYENNGMNDKAIMVLTLQNNAGQPLSGMYCSLEEAPNAEGFTCDEGELVLIIDKNKSPLINMQEVILQIINPLDTTEVSRHKFSLGFRKTMEIWAVTEIDDMPTGKTEKRINKDIKDIKSNIIGVEAFYKIYPYLKGNLKKAYWVQLGYATANDYERSFWDYLKEQHIVALPDYNRELMVNSSQDFYKRMHYTFNNFHWGVMSDYERELRMDFHAVCATKILSSKYEKYDDEVTAALFSSPSMYTLNKLKEEGEEIRELCVVITTEFNTSYSVKILEYIDLLVDSLDDAKEELKLKAIV